MTKIEPLHDLLYFKQLQDEERLFKAQREKNQITYRGKPIKIIDFSTENLKARRAWSFKH
jgi:hypothetical protein